MPKEAIKKYSKKLSNMSNVSPEMCCHLLQSSNDGVMDAIIEVCHN
jgi:hypothetical protein